ALRGGAHRVRQGVEFGRGELGPGLVDLGDGAVRLDEADVDPGGAGDRHLDEFDALREQQRGELDALGAARREHGEGLAAVRGERAGDVDALAARIGVDGRGPDHRAPAQRRDLQRAVQAGVGGQGDDHARTTLGPAAASSSATSASRPESVTTTSTSSTRPKRAKWSVENLVWSARTTVRRALSIICRFTAASAVSGVVRPRATEMPLVPMNATST